MKSKENFKQGRIKPKVILGFLMILGIAMAALGITYKGFIELSEMRQTLSDPSQKLIKLNSILTDIYEAESNIRTYTLTQNESYLSIYLSFMVNINDKVDSLLILIHNDAVQAEKIKFIQELLARKQRVLNELVHLKRGDQTSRFYQKALEQVESIDLDSLKESSVITSVTTTTTSRRDSVINRSLEDASLGGLNRFFRWFSKKQPPDTMITKLIVDVETQIDTLRRSVMSPSDSLLNEVVRILATIQYQQERALYNISEKELELIKSDKEIMDQIRTVVSLLEREELMNSYKLAEDVREAVSNSTLLLLALGGAAFFMVIVFTWLIFRDISKANFYRNKLISAKQYAEKLLKVKEEFMSNINHEIRTPLTAIVGLSKQLQKADPNPNQKLYIDSLNTSSQHLLQIVNDILDLSKIEGGHIKFERIPFSPFEVSNEALNTFALKAQEKGLSISLSTSSNNSIRVFGDPFRLRQILLNLIGNAIKFTSTGKVSVNIIATEAKIDRVHFTFEVSDTGIGIPNDQIESIFDQFSQVDSSTTRIYGGTGLGLTIVKKLTEQQGGTVEVHSKVGQGTTFTINLMYPKCPENWETSKIEIDLKKLKLPKNLKVIVIDDDPISQLLVNEMLKSLGVVNSKTYSNPLEALETIKNNTPGIVLTDIQMPGMSGIDLVQKIKGMSLKNNPVVIALTANNTADKLDSYAELGFFSALTKPFNEIDLYNVLAPIVGRDTLEYHKPTKLENIEDHYNISEIRRFAGEDDESTREILQSFIDNSKANIHYLTKFVAQKNWKGVGEVAHKMKSAFRQLNVYSIAITLEKLENINLAKTDDEKINVLVNSICKDVAKVQGLLNKDIEKLGRKSQLKQ